MDLANGGDNFTRKLTLYTKDFLPDCDYSEIAQSVNSHPSDCLNVYVHHRQCQHGDISQHSLVLVAGDLYLSYYPPVITHMIFGSPSVSLLETFSS